MTTKTEKAKANTSTKAKVRILPRPDRAQSFEKALAATVEQYGEALAKLAK